MKWNPPFYLLQVSWHGTSPEQKDEVSSVQNPSKYLLVSSYVPEKRRTYIINQYFCLSNSRNVSVIFIAFSGTYRSLSLEPNVIILQVATVASCPRLEIS